MATSIGGRPARDSHPWPFLSTDARCCVIDGEACVVLAPPDGDRPGLARIIRPRGKSNIKRMTALAATAADLYKRKTD